MTHIHAAWAFAIALRLPPDSVLYLCLCAALMGGSLGGILRSQPIANPDRYVQPIELAAQATQIAVLQTQVKQQAVEIVAMQARGEERDREISTLHGVGLGVGGLLTLLHIYQIARTNGSRGGGGGSARRRDD